MSQLRGQPASVSQINQNQGDINQAALDQVNEALVPLNQVNEHLARIDGRLQDCVSPVTEIVYSSILRQSL